MSLEDLNKADDRAAFDFVSPLIERAPSVAKRVAARRPFQDLDALSAAIRKELLRLEEAQKIELFRAHPELAPDNPLAMTAESQSEQGRLRLTSPQNEYRERLAAMNAEYRERFGFPFITALVRHSDMASVLDEFADRLTSDRASEISASIEQIAAVSAARVRAAFGPKPHSDGCRNGNARKGGRHAV